MPGQESQATLWQEVPRAGQVGMRVAAGEQLRTSSGRITSPFPPIDLSTPRKAGATLRRVETWLIENALAEAQARGDKFNACWMRQALQGPTQADKDGAEEYLFGQQPPVLRSSLKALTHDPVGKGSRNTASAALAA